MEKFGLRVLSRCVWPRTIQPCNRSDWDGIQVCHIPGSSIWCLFLPLLKNSRIVAVLAEKTPFLKINAVVRNCQPTWSGIFAVWSGIFAVWSGIFAAEKRAWQQYIRRNSGLPKKVVLVENLFIGQKAELSPLNGRGRYSRRQFVRLLHNFMHPILSRPRWNGASASATGDTSKKNQSDAALAIRKYVPGAHEITDAKRLDQSVSPHYFRSNDDGSVPLVVKKGSGTSVKTR